MSESHLWLGIRAGVHLSGTLDRSGVLDLGFWREAGGVERWRELHAAAERPSETHLPRRCTYAGRPFGEEAFVERLETSFQRKWRRCSFEKALGGRALAAGWREGDGAGW